MKIKELKYVDLKDIKIGEENARPKTNAEMDLEELAESIKSGGLIQPVVVIEQPNNKFKLIVGQRRFLAHKLLKRKEILALVIEVKDDTESKKISLSENLFRQDLPYINAYNLCKELFDKQKGTINQRIRGVSKELGISETRVRGYLKDVIIPDELKKMISDNKISRTKAYDITTSYYPDEEKIIEFAKAVSSKLTGSDQKRATEIAKENPKLDIKEILLRAKKPRVSYELTITFEPSSWDSFKKISNRRNKEPEDLAMEVIEDFIHHEETV